MEQEQETYLICAIFPSANIPIAISSLVASATMQGITGRKTLEIDISKINSGHIGVSSSNANGGYIYSIKLEV